MLKPPTDLTDHESASLLQLQQIPIERVMHSIDQGLVHLPSYRELYYRWERQQWQTQEIDFIPDRLQWEMLSEEEQQDLLYTMASFFQGEASVADAKTTRGVSAKRTFSITSSIASGVLTRVENVGPVRIRRVWYQRK